MGKEQMPEWLRRRLHNYRMEVMSEYTEAPLLTGVGGREFELLDMYFPVIQVGPEGAPVPGGAMVDPNGVPKFPAKSYDDGINNRDVIDFKNTRNTEKLDCIPNGTEALPTEALGTWRAYTKQITLAGGALAASNFQNVTGSRTNEISIDHISILGPLDAVGVVQMIFTFSVSGGTMTSNAVNIPMYYIFDAANSIIRGEFVKVFPAGFRLYASKGGAECRVAVAGGGGAETIEIGYHSRMDAGW
jgi:hypothetical protein